MSQLRWGAAKGRTIRAWAQGTQAITWAPWLAVLVWLFATVAAADEATAPVTGADPAHFPVPPSLHAATDFWRRVYTEVETSQGFIHDNRELGVVYEVVELGGELSRRQRSRLVSKRITHYRRILERLASGARSGLTDEQREVLSLWPEDVTNATLAQAAKRLRFQLGQANRFREGLARSGRYLDHIRAEFAALGLPEELALLPHVESSYNAGARSHAAAVGMWQFTRSTGRRFMQVDHVVDERLDPYLAAAAAARLLQQNHEDLGAWPLALTAYNHGVAGMRRATVKLGTQNIGDIVERYDGRTFGFASRNFYASFIAAVHVHQHASQYFGDVTPASPVPHHAVEIPDFVPAAALAESLGTDLDTLRKLNPALRWPIWRGEKHVPKGYALRVPATLDLLSAREALGAVPATQRFARQTPDVQHRVERGESLSVIGARYGVSARAIAELNGLKSAHLIRVGQTLKLPVRATQRAPTPAPVTAKAISTPATASSRPAATTAAVVTAPGGTYRVRRGDSISVIARRLGVRQRDLIAANRLSNADRLSVGQMLVVPGKGQTFETYVPEVYTVRRGDSVWEVAKRFGIPRNRIVSLNALKSGQHIFIGQKLRLKPVLGAAGATTAE
ncbi:MAG: LysM peptidoglycan-binding domain-containing protein [Pseudomonadota bacterium]